uniref:Uncharacterized protein n=1 Tax=viral metagenome TaxID=1070528 RepID=A0A6H2A0E7_9ZZZZ
MDKQKAIRKYANTRKNSDKRWYAMTYGMALLHGHTPPNRPQGLSYMGGQAVEMEIRDILREG